MDQLIHKCCHGTLSNGGEKQLYDLHQRRFKRRAWPLDASFFPGREKGTQAIESLGNGALASFRSESIYDGGTAFEQVVANSFPASGYLYFWRASATIKFLRHEGSSHLAARLNLFRNVRIHLREAFAPLGTVHGETSWVPKDSCQNPRTPEPNLDHVTVDLRNLRGKAAIRAVIEHVGFALTRNEIASIIERSLGLEVHETPMEPDVEFCLAPEPESVAASVDDERLRPKVERFIASLDADAIALLVARGYGEGGASRSLRAVAAELCRAEETLRRHERRIFERFRAVFGSYEEAEVAARLFAAAIAGGIAS